MYVTFLKKFNICLYDQQANNQRLFTRMSIKCKAEDLDHKIVDLSFHFVGDSFKSNQIRACFSKNLKPTPMKIFQELYCTSFTVIPTSHGKTKVNV